MLIICCGFLSKAVITVLDLIISLIPDIDIPLFEIPQTALQIFSYAWYFLPMGIIQTLFGLSLLLTSIRYTWAIILRIKSFIPGSGGT